MPSLFIKAASLINLPVPACLRLFPALCIGSLLFIIVFPSQLTAQNKSEKVTIEWGQASAAARAETATEMVGYDDDAVYVQKSKSVFMSDSEVFLTRYNQKLDETKKLEIPVGGSGSSKRYINRILHWNGELLVFTDMRNNSAKRRSLEVQSIDKRSFRLSGRPKPIAVVDYSGHARWNSGDFDLVLSMDSNKLLVVADLPYEKESKEAFGLHVYGPGMQKIWEKDIELPYTDLLFEVTDRQVDEVGDVYLLGRVYDEIAREKRRGKVNYRYEILAYRDQGERLERYPVDVEGRFLTDMKVVINTEGDLLCAGFYSDKGTFSIKGSYFLRIDRNTASIASQSYEEFGLDFITQNLSERKANKVEKKEARGKEVELYQYDLNNLVITADGGAVLVGEQFFIKVITSTTTSGTGVSTTRTTTIFYYNDIIVVNISPEGEIAWTQKIPKKQVTSQDGGFYSSYAMAVIRDKLYFVFNDNPKNLLNTEEGKIYNMVPRKESLVVLVEVSADGSVSKEALFSSKEVDIITVPKVCGQINETEMILFGKRKKDQRLARVRF